MSKFFFLFAVFFSLLIKIASPSNAKLKKIAPPLLDSDLSKNNYITHESKFKNKLDYENNDYIFTYSNDKTWLFDMQGNQLKEWNTPSVRAVLLKNCNLLVIEDNQQQRLAEKNELGEIIWQYNPAGIVHHDFELTDDGHMIFLYRKNLPEIVSLKNGCNHNEVLTDTILEIDREGNQYFNWEFYENYSRVLQKTKCTKERKEENALNSYDQRLDWIHPNAIDILKDNKCYRKGYKEFKPGNILVTLHHLHKVILIEKETKKVIWVYTGDELNLESPHEAKMIEEGLPGAGNILIYDNGLYGRNYTRILEINPITKKTVWKYQNPGEFYNPWSGSHQRLKNGDTVISDTGYARAFIVDKKGKVKWQFKQPGSTWSKRVKLYPRKDFAHCFAKDSK
jgi:hypothetical protein